MQKVKLKVKFFFLKKKIFFNNKFFPKTVNNNVSELHIVRQQCITADSCSNLFRTIQHFHTVLHNYK